MSVGDTVRMVVGFSEAACHLRIAGQVRRVTLLENGMAQVWNDDGTPFSFPITAGEAGIYRDVPGFYVVQDGCSPLDV